jgi:hypothetical protein
VESKTNLNQRIGSLLTEGYPAGGRAIKTLLIRIYNGKVFLKMIDNDTKLDWFDLDQKAQGNLRKYIFCQGHFGAKFCQCAALK